MARNGDRQWEHFQLLCRLLGSRQPPLAGAQLRESLEPLIALADSQQMLPALAQQLGTQPVEAGCGQELTHKLTNALKENTLRNLAISAQTLKLTHCLNEAGITPLLLKGAAFLHSSLRDKLGFRYQVDIDIALPKAIIPLAVGALRRTGYHFLGEDVRAYPEAPDQALRADDESLSSRALNARHHHLYPLFKKDQPVSVEIHRHYLPRRFQRGNDVSELFSRAERLKQAGAHFLVPSAEDQLVQLILGTVVHDGYLLRRQFPLREACDLHRLCRENPGLDRGDVAERCGESFALMEQLVSLLLESKKPEAEQARAASALLAGMRRRQRSPQMGRLYNSYARCHHLAYGLRHNPGKLGRFIRRRFPQAQR